MRGDQLFQRTLEQIAVSIQGDKIFQGVQIFQAKMDWGVHFLGGVHSYHYRPSS